MVAYGSVSTGSGASVASYTVARPASTASGDILIAWTHSDVGTIAGITLTGGATWNLLGQVDNSGSNRGLAKLWWKVAGSSEPANYTVGADSGADSTTIVLRATSGAQSAPVFAINNVEQSGTSISTPSVTPAGTNDLLIRIAGVTPFSVNNTWTAPANHTLRAQVITSARYSSSAVATRQLTTGGATGTASFTASNSTNGKGYSATVAIADALQTVVPEGVASGEAFGTAKTVITVPLTGVPSSEAFGDTFVFTPTPQTITPEGIASGTVFGTAVSKLYLNPPGIASGEAFGSPRPAALIRPSGIASAEAFGTPNAAIEQFVTPTGVTSLEAFGTASLDLGYPQTIIGAGGIVSLERVPDILTVRNVKALIFRPPSIQETPAGKNVLHIRYGVHRGISVIKRSDGTIYQTRYPALTDLEVADKYWMGGYRHIVSVEEADELTTAGYGDNITLEEV